MINIVIPMAGRGSRFSDAGFSTPKPLININKKAMIEVVCNNLASKKYDYQIILICQKEMLDNFNLKEKLSAVRNIRYIEIEKLTDGQLSTILLAKEYIDNDDYLLCANCDQYVDLNIDDFYDFAIERDLDGLIMTMPASHPKWSYSKVNDDGYVIETAEKQVISNEATAGLYFFKHGSSLISAANEIVENNMRVNGEFYVCPCYNYLIKKSHKIMNYNIANKMHGLGTPPDLCDFLSTELSRKV